MTTKPRRSLSTAFSLFGKDNIAPPASKGLLGLYLRVKRAVRTALLKRQGRKLTDSYFRTAEAMGLDPYKDRQPEFQVQKLKAVNELAAQLRQLNFGHIHNNSSR